MSRNDHMLIFFRATLIGIVGVLLLVVFFAALMSIGTVEKLLPFIIGFNGALTGYNLINREKDRLKYKRMWSIVCGIIMVIGVAFILNITFYYLTGAYIVFSNDFLFLVFIGGLFSWLGAILAVKYFML